MRSRILAITLVVMFPVFLFSQQRVCGTMDYLKQEIKEFPQYQKNIDKIEAHTRQFIQARGATFKKPGTPGGGGGGGNSGGVTIPVVFHVVYNTAAENVPDKQLLDQLAVLNADYSASNQDVNKVPAAFSSLVADFGIQFCLATVDPTGNPTNGIRRVKTSKTSFSTNDNVKFTRRGGDDAWPSNQYFNIWVCNLGGGLLGYATFPGGRPEKDGIVILYSSLPGGSAVPYDKGRTATHEAGHWLNLRHIWGDSNCGNDYVDDTPTQQAANFGCPVFPHVTCNNGPNGDMFMNYMDYTNDACMFMFTQGQSIRSNALFSSGGARTALLTSTACGTGSRRVGTGTVTGGDQSALRVGSSMQLYPSPVHSILTIELGTTIPQTIRIFNLMGQQVLQVSGAQGTTRLDVSNLSRGVYMLKAGDGKTGQLQRFIKE